LETAFASFCAQSNLSPITLKTYRYALHHFYAFLQGSSTAQSLSLAGSAPSDRSLVILGSEPQDVNLLAWFVNYLGREVKSANPKRSRRSTRELLLEPATVRLYGQAILTWFRFLGDELLLPDAFPAAAAIARAQRQLRTYVPRSMAREGAIEPPEGMEVLIRAYDSPSFPDDLPLKERNRRELETLRNRALLYALADSGARISEILRLTADQIRGARVNAQGVSQIRVRGKGRGRYGREVTLRFTLPTLEAMRAYLRARKDPSATVLFVSHAKTRPAHRGKPFSANAAWRMIQRTAKSLGLPHIHPHDFRHWRATQMLSEGVPIDQVQRFLNHRSIRTTQLYAKTAEQQVDEAGARTSPLTP
jgi:site-specific recombinase XerD